MKKKETELKFKYTIKKGDYEAFYTIVNGFFTDEDVFKNVVGGVSDVLTKISFSPHLEDQIQRKIISINDLFRLDYVVEGISTISKNTFQIQYEIREDED